MMQASGIPEVLQQLCPPLLLSLPLVSGQIPLFPGQWTDPSCLWADATGVLEDPLGFGKIPLVSVGILTDRTTLTMGRCSHLWADPPRLWVDSPGLWRNLPGICVNPLVQSYPHLCEDPSCLLAITPDICLGQKTQDREISWVSKYSQLYEQFLLRCCLPNLPPHTLMVKILGAVTHLDP